MTTTEGLYKSNSDRILCGVSGGLAEYFDVDPSLVRLTWIVLACLTFGVAILGYAFLYIVMPVEEDVAAARSNTGGTSSRQESYREEDAVLDDELTEEARVLLDVRRELGPEYEDELVDSFAAKVEESLKSRRAKSQTKGNGNQRRVRNRSFLPLLTLGIGAALLLANFGGFSWFSWVTLCSLAVIGVGVALLLRRASN